jgi:hypothetical protein
MNPNLFAKGLEKNAGGRPLDSNQNNREIYKIASKWYEEYNRNAEVLNQWEKEAEDRFRRLFDSEDKIVAYRKVLINQCRAHNEIDNLLNEIIDKQNKLTSELDRIKEAMIEKAIAEAKNKVECIEEVYEKSERVVENTREVEDKVQEYIGMGQAMPKFDDTTMNGKMKILMYLELNMVRDI